MEIKERLTMTFPDGAIQLRDNNVNAAVVRLSEYEDTWLTPEEIKGLKRELMDARATHRTEYCEDADYDCVLLGKYRKIEDKGRRISLPCNVGDTVYVTIKYYSEDRIVEAEFLAARVVRIIIGESGVPLADIRTGYGKVYTDMAPEDYYTSLEEARAALRKDQGSL